MSLSREEMGELLGKEITVNVYEGQKGYFEKAIVVVLLENEKNQETIIIPYLSWSLFVNFVSGPWRPVKVLHVSSRKVYEC